MGAVSRFMVQTDAPYAFYRNLRGVESWFPADSRLVPITFACFILVAQLLHAIISTTKSFTKKEIPTIKNDEGEVEQLASTQVPDQRPLGSKWDAYIRGFGGYTIFGFMTARLVGCIALIGLTAVTATCDVRRADIWSGWRSYFAECPDRAMLVTYDYSAVLSVLALLSKTWRASATRFNVALLTSVALVYAYRDIWPSVTYDKRPEDLAEGDVLWVKLGVLFFTAVIIPLAVPRPYVPVDPKNPMAIVNPEQTSSILSYLTFAYVDKIVWKGYRVDHLPVTELPPLPDYDDAAHLKLLGARYLDVYNGAKSWSIYLALLKTFHTEYFLMVIGMILVALSTFVSPIGINRILNYLETGGVDSTVQPWFWIIWLLLGPIISSLLTNWYFYVSQATMVRVEALLTEIIFEHTLRIRLKAETPEKKAESGVETPKSGASTPKASGSSTPAGQESSTPGHSQTSTAVEAEGHAILPSDASTVVAPANASSESNGKGKAKATPPQPRQTGEDKKLENISANFTGRLNNLVTSDLEAVSQARDWLMIFFSVPLIITLSMAFLYKFLGWSCFVFLVLTLAFMGIPGYVSTLIAKTQKAKMKATDARVQSVTEIVNILRMVKLFGWENQMEKRIHDKREEELKLLRKQKILNITNGLMGYFIPTLTMLLTYATYVVIMKGTLTPSKIFSTMVVFETVRNSFQRVIWQANIIIQGKVSLDRIGDFLNKSELLDQYDKTQSPHQPEVLTSTDITNPDIGFRNATFMWSKEDAESIDESRRRFTLRVDGELLFKPGRINLIVGPTGSGKTSILMALLGEMHFIATDPDSWYGLPREGGVAYAAQESWILNDTIRNNILFGSPYDEGRYKKVIEQCALERDMDLFEAGDQTEVGEKGLTLSGGQKARVTLARAVYCNADVLLLDDILAALDVHTAAWIVDNCLKGDLIKGRTIVLITHNVALASPIADFIVSVGLDGKIATQGVDISDILTHDPALASEVEKDKEATEIAGQDIHETEESVKPTSGKLILTEEVAHGRVTPRAFQLLFKSFGGAHPYMFFAIFVASYWLTEAVMTFQVWFLGYWGSQYETRDPSEVPATLYVLGYGAGLSTCIIIYTFAWMFYIYGNIRASRKINALLIDSVLRSTLRWLDETPTGRIITRCTQDMRSVDSTLPSYMRMVLDCVLVLVTKLGAIILFTPFFVFPGLGFAVIGVFIGNVYQKAQLSVKRESSNAKAPVLSHFSASVQGLVSIRAYGAQKVFTGESFRKINYYTHLSRTTFSLNRWIAVRIDVLGALFSAALAFYLVYGPRAKSSTAGFILNMSVEFTMSILWLVRIYNEFEVESNSLERILGYIDIDHEPKATEEGKPPAYWPATGDLRVEHLSARYFHSGPRVLHDISFHVKSGERVGIVGRTGSGKSSLTFALLRAIITEGTVYYDGLPTNKLNLDPLRSNITIIPQIPELLSGTLRQNLDPLNVEDDATLHDALRSAGLFSLQEEEGQARLTLDTNIAGGGSNLSVGQKQILALARAMIRGSKILILDEATSAIDYKTDGIIQKTLREQLPKDTTVLTVAHRLQTVMDSDKILVLDEGKIVEFDQPKELLKKEKGVLRALVDGSGDKDLLYRLAEGNKA